MDMGLGLALGTAASVSLTEGDSLSLTVNVTNDSGGPITPFFITETVFPPTQPDIFDFGFADYQQNTETCGFAGNPIILANGAACSFDLVLHTDDVPVIVVDFDSGVSLTQLGMTFRTQGVT